MYYLLYYQNITLKLPTTNKCLGKGKKEGRKERRDGGILSSLLIAIKTSTNLPSWKFSLTQQHNAPQNIISLSIHKVPKSIKKNQLRTI